METQACEATRTGEGLRGCLPESLVNSAPSSDPKVR